MSELSRRGFLSALAGAGVLSLGFEYGCAGDGTQTRVRHAESTGDLIPNMYITVKRDGRVGVEVDNCDFGQGVTSMFSTLVAEELDVDLAAVDCHFPDSLAAYRTTVNMQITGGSASTREKYLPVRTAAAAAKGMLVAAAAAEWRVSPAECTTARGFVSHPGSGRTIGYGALTVAAARQPVPASPRLKAKSAFTLIGKPARRVDARAKVDGSARFGIDTVVPGMARAYILHGPVYGANAIRGARRRRPQQAGHRRRARLPRRRGHRRREVLASARRGEGRRGPLGPGRRRRLDTERMRRAVHAYADDGDAVRDDGNAARAIARAASKVSATYEAPFLAHAPMEPQNCIVHVRKDVVEVVGAVPVAFHRAGADRRGAGRPRP